MKEITVIGIGSRIMGDDGIGIYIVEELIKQNFMREIKYIIGETDVEYCLNQIGPERYIFIIDAAIFGGAPGTVTEFAFGDWGVETNNMLSTHNYSLIEAVSKQLQDYNLKIIGIEPEFVGFQYGLSFTLTEAFPYIVEKVKKALIIFLCQPDLTR